MIINDNYETMTMMLNDVDIKYIRGLRDHAQARAMPPQHAAQAAADHEGVVAEDAAAHVGHHDDFRLQDLHRGQDGGLKRNRMGPCSIIFMCF